MTALLDDPLNPPDAKIHFRSRIGTIEFRARRVSRGGNHRPISGFARPGRIWAPHLDRAQAAVAILAKRGAHAGVIGEHGSDDIKGGGNRQHDVHNTSIPPRTQGGVRAN